jgi:hypothetical protein
MKVDTIENFHYSIYGISIDTGEMHTGHNTPTYGITSFKQNLTVFWDLGPRINNPEQLQILETPSDEIVIVIKSNPRNNYYDNKSYWFESSEFNEDLHIEWFRSKQIAILRFNPLYYNLSNFIQFNPELSETIHSTVVFPRIRSAIELPLLFHPWQLDVDYFATYNTKTDNLDLYVTLFDTVIGPKNSILRIDHEGNIFNASAGFSGSSLFKLEVDLGSHEIIRTEKILGPNEPFDEYFNEDFSGWSVWDIVGVYSYWNSGEEYTVYFIRGQFISSINILKGVYSQKMGLCIIDRRN